MPTDNFDSYLDNALLSTIDTVELRAAPSGPNDLPIYDVLRYHLGFLNEQFHPDRVTAGKRIRPRLCQLTCVALGGRASQSIPAAAAIEFLHNFTLIHDDIQDQSVFRRHRRTIWDVWGTAQAINAGDAMFALAHLALNRLNDVGVLPATILDLSTALHNTTLRIVEGQVLDLGFEHRHDVAVNDYMTMIGGKTAELTRYACWAGARIAGADEERADALAEFGMALGIGFQLRDDILGVWGTTNQTGKNEADDIRRRKKSLPILLLRERATAAEHAILDEIYSVDDVTDAEVAHVLKMMQFHEVEHDVQAQVRRWHDRARMLLESAVEDSAARRELQALVLSLEGRAG